MSALSTTREALIIEALGEAAQLIRQVEALIPAMDASCQALAEAHSGLAGQLATFEARAIALADHVKMQAVKHVAVRTDEVARQSIDQQTRAMADAARVAFGGELGAIVQRLQSTVQMMDQRRPRPWLFWVTHAALAAAASAITWMLAQAACTT